MKRKHWFLTIQIANVIFMLACRKQPKNILPTPVLPVVEPKAPEPDIYISGNLINSFNFSSKAVYWKNGKMIELSPEYSISEANSIAVRDTNIFVAGSVYDEGKWKAIYWKNGKVILLGEGRAYCIVLHGEDVYIGGFIQKEHQYLAAYWKNGNAVTLESSIENSTQYPSACIRKMVVDGGTIYSTGFSSNSGIAVATYWKNTSVTPLTTYIQGYGNLCAKSYGSDIAIKLDDVFIAGGIIPATGFLENKEDARGAVYWKNGIPVQLTKNELYTETFGVFLENNDVYLCGQTDSTKHKGVYWKNGEAFNLLSNIPVPLNMGLLIWPLKITLFKGAVYVVGYSKLYNNNNAFNYVISYACFWKNGIPVTLREAAEATDIVIKGKKSDR